MLLWSRVGFAGWVGLLVVFGAIHLKREDRVKGEGNGEMNTDCLLVGLKAG